MKTGEPTYPITNERGCKLGEMRVVAGRVVVNFTCICDELDKGDLQGIIDLMEKKELDLCLQKSA